MFLDSERVFSFANRLASEPGAPDYLPSGIREIINNSLLVTYSYYGSRQSCC